MTGVDPNHPLLHVVYVSSTVAAPATVPLPHGTVIPPWPYVPSALPAGAAHVGPIVVSPMQPYVASPPAVPLTYAYPYPQVPTAHHAHHNHNHHQHQHHCDALGPLPAGHAFIVDAVPSPLLGPGAGYVQLHAVGAPPARMDTGVLAHPQTPLQCAGAVVPTFHGCSSAVILESAAEPPRALVLRAASPCNAAVPAAGVSASATAVPFAAAVVERRGSGSVSDASLGSSGTSLGAEAPSPSHGQLIVNFLPPSVTSPSFAAIFQDCEGFLSTKLMFDSSNNSRCFGFAYFATPADARAAMLKKDGLPMDGKRIKVQWSLRPNDKVR